MISSKDNEIIKLAQKIKDKKYSRAEGLALVETIKIINELHAKSLVKHILVREDKLSKVSHITNVKIDTISPKICDFLSDAMTSDGVFAICKIPPISNIDYNKCLVLDGIQDPSNIGAIIRSANAFGFKTIFAINSVYPYLFKCIRSSMGYVFDINYIDTTYSQLLDIKKNNNITLITADMNGINVDTVNKTNDNIAIIIGNEGNGVSTELQRVSDMKISIPMENGVESLNASVSAGILMYLLK
jgi:TrmH family RNA methyltransferase